jgi:hypothetical protein
VKIDSETLAFMRKHGINEGDLYDAGQKPRRYWQSKMQAAGKRFVYVEKPCKRGHRLRNRPGLCVLWPPVDPVRGASPLTGHGLRRRF